MTLFILTGHPKSFFTARPEAVSWGITDVRSRYYFGKCVPWSQLPAVAVKEGDAIRYMPVTANTKPKDILEFADGKALP